MTTQKTHTEKTSADDKSIGFDYQYYYFMYRLLKMRRHESVGLEVKDDVHTELSCNRQILIQLKHTTQQKSDGTPKNITTYDSDLWKTLSNWSKVVKDKVAGRDTEKSQLDFISKTDFMLVTNKSKSKSCRFFDLLAKINGARIPDQSRQTPQPQPPSSDAREERTPCDPPQSPLLHRGEANIREPRGQASKLLRITARRVGFSLTRQERF